MLIKFFLLQPQPNLMGRLLSGHHRTRTLSSLQSRFASAAAGHGHTGRCPCRWVLDLFIAHSLSLPPLCIRISGFNISQMRPNRLLCARDHNGRSNPITSGNHLFWNLPFVVASALATFYVPNLYALLYFSLSLPNKLHWNGSEHTRSSRKYNHH